MTELKFDPMDEPPSPEEKPPERPRSWLLPLLVAVAVFLATGYWLQSRRSATAPGDGSPTSAPPPATPPSGAIPDAALEVPAADVRLPVLAESDDFVRARIAELFGSAELDRWLLSGEDLLQQTVRSIVALSKGRSPRRFLSFVPLRGDFSTVERVGRWFIAPESDRRYDSVVDLIVRLDGERLVDLERLLAPLLSQAMDENAFPGTEFRTVLRAAIDHLLATPVPGAGLEVVPGEDGIWRYADPSLEALTPAQKHLLRLGAANGDRVRRRLADWRALL